MIRQRPAGLGKLRHLIQNFLLALEQLAGGIGVNSPGGHSRCCFNFYIFFERQFLFR